MPDLTDTQIRVLERAAARTDALAMPLPKGLHGAAAKKAVARMIDHGFLKEVDAKASRDEPLWRETGDGHGKTLIATEAGLAAIGLSPAEIRNRLDRRYPVATEPTPSTPRAGTKQARLVEMLSVPGGATVAEISEATGWQPHTVRGTISGALRKKLGLHVISVKTEERGRVYRLT